VRIRTDNGQRMILAGVPHGAGWMVFAFVLGLAIIAAAVAFARGLYQQGQWGGVGAMGVGVCIGLVIAWVGATEILKRERLTLDRTTGRGVWRRWNILRPAAAKERTFDLAKGTRVRLSRSTERRPRASASGPTEAAQALHAEASVVRADLLISSPRLRIRLDETENGRDRRVTQIAERVAGFLDVDLEQDPPR